MSLQNNSPYTISTGRQVLGIETNDRRFEDFCRQVVSRVEGGALILGTSASWDLGRDGSGVGRSSGIYLCASLRDDVDSKALSDIARIIATTPDIKRLYFCSSKELSEHRRSAIEQSLIQEVDFAFPITVLGAAQLVEIAAEDVAILNKHYAAEIEDCLRALTSETDDENELKGLRLALISTGEDSSTIRGEIYRASIIDALSICDGQSLQSLCKSISDRLHLMRNLAREAIAPSLQELTTECLITSSNGIYWLTLAGRERLKIDLGKATGELLTGRAAVREAIEGAIGSRLADDHFNKIWVIFEEHLVAYCISRGQDLVSAVSEILGEENSGVPTRQKMAQFPFVLALAEAVSATSSSSQQRVELKQAVEDIFVERTGPAINWLVKLCGNFVAACSLGLEQSCGNAIESLLRRTYLVFDTDVVLSLLGMGEVDHDAVEAISKRWKSMRGQVFVAEPVLEEVAYHAWIAQRDFEQVANWLPGTSDERQQFIDNVFVRSFAELLSRGDAKLHQWHAYLKTFKGASEYAWEKVYAELHATFNLERLPPRALAEAKLEDSVRTLLISKGQDKAWTDIQTRNLRDKSRRDAQLYSAMVSHLKELQRVDPATTCLLVSSAKRLAIAEATYKGSGEPELIVSISTVLHLLSLVPNVSLGLTAMRAFLFDERPNTYSGDFERTVLRMVRSSEQISMPWAKRAALMRSVREKMVSDAKSRGIETKINELERAAFLPTNRENTIGVLKFALDAVAVDSKTAKDNLDLRKKVEELEAALRLAKQKSSGTARATKAKPYKAPRKR